MYKFLTVGAFILTIVATAMAPATAAEYRIGDITIVNPWARATPGVPRNGGAYLTIMGGASDDELIDIETDVAGRSELHGHKNENGVMKMHAVNGLEIPAKGMATLKPGGYHIMLMKLKGPLKEGESFAMDLHFAKAGKITVEVKIMGVGAMDADEASTHGGHDKMKMKK
ncbi:MAG: copper chaperone PCu(A)C [Proteobacteria bacterium]|nr:copper chaperone PCu(A)C [Pseudomonadota bacterium]